MGILWSFLRAWWSNPSEPDQSQCVNHSIQPKKLRNPLVTILKEILRVEIKLDDKLIKENNAILSEFYETFVAEMKQSDDLFKRLYQAPYYTGSYFSALRITTPDEYDINLVLKIPGELEVEYLSQAPSYATYKLKKEISAKDETVMKLLFEDGYLMPEKVRTWIQSVVDKARRTYINPQKVKSIRNSASGPARTFYLQKYQNGQIDIDLVPAIKCTPAQKPPQIDGRVYSRFQNKLQCFLIPKPYITSKQPPINEKQRAKLWRIHYPDSEREMIYNKGCVKSVIKLLKLLKNKEKWNIASYYITTVLMWMVLEHPDDSYWREDNMGGRFLDALEKLSGFLEKRNIPYFFSSKYNLISKMSPVTATNINGRLCSIIKLIKQDPSNLWKIYGVKPTFTMLHAKL